ncbi:MAG: arginase family protein, partial [Firmicutes bacterium]|nr:arginase family protein [Bacillota bacterium]
LLTRYPDLHVLWFDAHPDFLNEAQSTTHFLDGMSMARVVGLAGSQSGLLRRDQITLLGGQEVEEAESQAMTKWGLDCVRLQEIDAWVKGSLPGGDLFLHVDADVLDPADMPAVDFPVTPGMRAGQLLDVCTRIAATGRLRGIEVTCYNPALDEMDRGGRRLRSLIETVLPA